MEQCFTDQQFVTNMQYLDNICIFGPIIDVMLNRIVLAFNRLKYFHLQIKPEKCHLFEPSVVFVNDMLSADGISTNPEKVEKFMNRPILKKNAEDIH